MVDIYRKSENEPLDDLIRRQPSNVTQEVQFCFFKLRVAVTEFVSCYNEVLLRSKLGGSNPLPLLSVQDDLRHYTNGTV